MYLEDSLARGRTQEPVHLVPEVPVLLVVVAILDSHIAALEFPTPYQREWVREPGHCH